MQRDTLAEMRNGICVGFTFMRLPVRSSLYGGVRMVNEKKVHIMTQLALDEEKKYRNEIKEGGYYKTDYVRSHVMSSIGSCTVSYILILFLTVLYHADYIFVNVARLQYGKAGVIVLGVYLLIVLLSGGFSYRYFSRKYEKNRVILQQYCSRLKELEVFYTQNKEEAGNDTIAGL